QQAEESSRLAVRHETQQQRTLGGRHAAEDEADGRADGPERGAPGKGSGGEEENGPETEYADQRALGAEAVDEASAEVAAKHRGHREQNVERVDFTLREVHG